MFRERLKELREKVKLTQADLAEKLNIGRASISNYELGTRTPDIETLSLLASFFHVTTDYLIGNSSYKTAEEAYEFKAMKISDEIEKYNDIAFKNALDWAMFPMLRNLEYDLSDTVELYERLFWNIAHIEAFAVRYSTEDAELNKFEVLRKYFETYNKVKLVINEAIDEIALKSISYFLSDEGKAKIDADLINLCEKVFVENKPKDDAE